MEVYHFFLCCVLFTTAASFSLQNAVPEETNDDIALETQTQNCECENGKCVTDKQGHSKCVCKPGFALQDKFNCQPCDCGSLGKCLFILKQTEDGDNHEYHKKCVCDVGKAEKDGVCVDCDCGSNSACDFDFGEKRCYCIEGYSEKDGVCTQCDCGFYGQCEYENDNKKCECDEGYLELDGVCEECDCGNNGTCSFTNGQKTCECQPGFSVNDGICESCDCGSNSVNCALVDGAKQCQCKDRYSDRYGTCEECYCGDQSRSCDFNDNQKTCSCLDGYVQKGETCEIGCSDQKPCLNGGYCKGGFCFCLNGTRGEFCDVIDDCSNLCPNEKETACVYNVTSQTAQCKCLDGNLKYNPDTKQCTKFCEKDKECENGGKCGGKGTNRFCECPPGTRGDKCEIVDDCVSGKVKCDGLGTSCVYDAKKKVATCQCKDKDKEYDSLTGKCRRSCDKDKECLNGAKCRYKGSKKFCECLKGTQGDRCEIIDDCASGKIKCRGDRAYCDFDVKTLKSACKCKDRGKEYDARNGRCRRRNHHHHHSSEESSDESSEEKKKNKNRNRNNHYYLD